MDRQAVFKKVSKILIPIEIIFLITSAVVSGVVFYSAFNEYVKTHKVDMQQLYHNLIIILIILSIFSIILASIFVFCFAEKKRVKRTVNFSIAIFLTIIFSIIFQFTIYQYGCFPLSFFGSAFITLVCKFLARIPNGIRAKVKQYINLKKNGA